MRTVIEVLLLVVSWLLATLAAFGFGTGTVMIFGLGIGVLVRYRKTRPAINRAFIVQFFAYTLMMMGNIWLYQIIPEVQTQAGAHNLDLLIFFALYIPSLLLAVGSMAVVARLKGRSRWLSVLALISIIGFLILIALPDRRDEEVPLAAVG